MKRAIIDLPDDFEKGNCLTCPLAYLDEEYDMLWCVLEGTPDDHGKVSKDKCPLKIIDIPNISTKEINDNIFEEDPELQAKVKQLFKWKT